MFDTGLNQSELEQAKKDLKEKVIFFENWVHIVNSSKHNNYVTNPKLQKAFEREMSDIPKKMIEYIDKYDTSINTSIHTTNNHKSKIINHKSKTEDKGVDSLTVEYCQKIASHYEIPVSQVLKKKDDLILYCKANGKRYKDYQAALQNWVRKDLK